MARPCVNDHHPQYALGDEFSEGTCKVCWLYANRPEYRAVWDAPQAAATPAVAKVKKESREPVGDLLAQEFAWLGQVKSGMCGCAFLQAKMNGWGAAGCRENYDRILTKLEKAAFERDIPMARQAFIPFLEVAIWRGWLHGLKAKPK